MRSLIALMLAGSVSFATTTALIGGPVLATPQWQSANSTSTGDQDSAAIAANRHGYVAVVWEDDRDSSASGDTVHSEVFLRLFRHGSPVYELKLSAAGTSGAPWRHLSPDVGLDDKGNAVVVWADDPDGNGYYNIAFRVVSTTGAISASGYANSVGAGQQVNPKVAVDADGAPVGGSVAFTVVWEDIQGSNPATVMAAGFTGATRNYEVIASPSTGQHHRPDVAVSASGISWVVWESGSDIGSDIGLVRVSKAGALGTRTAANSLGDGQQTRPSIEATFNGEFAVAWLSDHSGTPGVWTRSFTPAGTGPHPEVLVADGGLDPRVGVDEQGGVVVVWTVQAATLDTWVRGFNPDGSDTGRLAAQPLMNLTDRRQEGIRVAVSPWGEVSVAYTDDNDGNTFDQVYLGVGVLNTGW